ncbi:MAG TPA: hypothetical protein VFN14_02410 [Candidatus Limnocylindria bacterium]|nr:hypothetical protein [Candidatus Limnocylindria bacterium]
MAVGLLWLTRLPVDSTSWEASLAEPASLVPPLSYWVDLFPALVVFAVGLTIMVAPLTTALMNSVPERNSGIASAINNAISRVGPLLAGAVIFVAVTGAFYSGMQSRVPSMNVDDPAVRRDISPLNQPAATVPAADARAANESSTDAFHLAMLIAALLCAAGAAVNGVGIRNQATADQIGEPAPAATG